MPRNATTPLLCAHLPGWCQSHMCMTAPHKHVQGRYDNWSPVPQEERLKAGKYNEALRLRVKEQREAGRENRRELRRAQRSLRAYEVIRLLDLACRHQHKENASKGRNEEGSWQNIATRIHLKAESLCCLKRCENLSSSESCDRSGTIS